MPATSNIVPKEDARHLTLQNAKPFTHKIVHPEITHIPPGEGDGTGRPLSSSKLPKIGFRVLSFSLWPAKMNILLKKAA